MTPAVVRIYSKRKLAALLAVSFLVPAIACSVLAGPAAAMGTVSTIPVGPNPARFAYNQANGRLYVTNSNYPAAGSVSAIDLTTDTTIGSPISVGNGPIPIGANPNTNKLYVGDSGTWTVSVINAATGTVSSTVDMGAVNGLVTGVGVNPATNKIYVGRMFAGDIAVIDGATDTVKPLSIAVGFGPGDVAVNQVTNRVYVSRPQANELITIDGGTDTIIGAPLSMPNPSLVSVDTTNDRVYVSNAANDTVTVVDGATGAVTTTIPVGDNPQGIGINHALDRVYVANSDGGDVSVVNSDTNTVVGTVPVGDSPMGVWANPADGRVYVSNGGDDTVSVLNEVWFLAEGTSAWGFSTYITIENPNNVQCTAGITYNTTSGVVEAPDVSLPPNSQTTVNPEAVVPDRDFSTMVVSREGRPIAVDRTMQWTGSDAPSPEGHSSVGVISPSRVWFLPEGSSEWGFECWLLIQNPNPVKADCTVTYMTEVDGPIEISHTVPAGSRESYNMETDIGKKDASIKVEADVPVIPERAMYRNNRREGHDSIGTTAPATDYYLAEGTTAWGFTTYVLVQNPQNTPVDVTITYMTPSGPQQQPVFQMAANSRKTVRVNDIDPAHGYAIDVSNTDVSTRVHGSQPIIAERAMYWDYGLGEACHDSIGMAAPRTTFYLPDGQTSEGRETWTLVQNPNDTDVNIEVTYLTSTGSGNVTFPALVPANSRVTFDMSASGLLGRAGVKVTCTTPGKKIMCERAMYWNSRGAGTDTIGGCSD